MRQEPLEKRVLRFIQEHNLVSRQQKVVVAVSGGPDSVCLLHIMVGLQEELDMKLHVAHLNHQLRGADSEADAHYVSNLAQQLGILATIEKGDVKSYQAWQHLSREEAAREVRYAFLAQVAGSIGAGRVVVGHTIDDHIETILLHLVRGTGTRGLRGLLPSSRWKSTGDSLTVVRPLLPVSRDETVSYCHHHHLMPRLDTSNLSLSPLRNIIRHQLLPLLRSYNPRVDEALLRTARIAADDLSFLDKEIGRLRSESIQKQGNSIILDRERFDGLPPALKRNLLRASIEELLGSLKDIESRHIEEVMDALNKPVGKRLILPMGLIFSIEYNRYLLGRDLAALCPFPCLETEFTLKIPGETYLPGWHLGATIINPERESGRGESPLINLPPSLSGEGDKGDGLPESLIAYFDLDRASDRLVVRSRQPGDSFQPLGMAQPKKLGEFMIDAKIPQSWRQRIPVVCSPAQILWVVGWRIDDRVKVTEDTKQVLCLKFELQS